MKKKRCAEVVGHDFKEGILKCNENVTFRGCKKKEIKISAEERIKISTAKITKRQTGRKEPARPSEIPSVSWRLGTVSQHTSKQGDAGPLKLPSRGTQKRRAELSSQTTVYDGHDRHYSRDFGQISRPHAGRYVTR